MSQPTAWRTLALTLAKNPISLFAVLCVMATGAFLGYITLRLLGTISSFDWCAKAVQADRITPGNTFVGLTSCVELLKLQVQAQSSALLISIGGYNFVLVVLIVVVVAGARAAGKLPGGIEFNVSRDDPGDDVAKAAGAVATAATDKAAEIKQDVKDEPTGPRPGGAV